MSIKITKGSRSDVSVLSDLVKGLKGKVYGYKGYISKQVFMELCTKGLKVFSSLK